MEELGIIIGEFNQLAFYFLTKKTWFYFKLKNF